MRFSVLALVGASVFVVACGSADEVVPTAEVTPTIGGAPSEPSTATGDERSAASPTSTLPPSTATETAEPAPCITSGIPDDGSGVAAVPADEQPAIEEPAEEPPATMAGFASRPAEEPGPLPDPTTIAWLAPETTPCGLVLREANRDLGVDCEHDCGTTVPTASLRYASDDESLIRDVVVAQYLPASLDHIEFDATATRRTIDGRDVMFTEPADAIVVAFWAEPSGIHLDVSGRGVTVDDLVVVVESLVVLAPDDWPGDQVVKPDPVCVDDTTRYAPTALPEGWNRFVLDIAPNGACDVAPFLFMSLVIPGSEVAPGTLVTFVIGPGGGSLAEGEVSAITVGDHPATLSELVDPTGRPANSVVFRVGEITVDAHGNADVATLLELAESVAPVDIATWEQLAAEMQPSG